jgi:hypothetical protein
VCVCVCVCVFVCVSVSVCVRVCVKGKDPEACTFGLREDESIHACIGFRL